MYNKIINPLDNQEYSIFSPEGKALLKNYVKEFYGGSFIWKTIKSTLGFGKKKSESSGRQGNSKSISNGSDNSGIDSREGTESAEARKNFRARMGRSPSPVNLAKKEMTRVTRKKRGKGGNQNNRKIPPLTGRYPR